MTPNLEVAGSDCFDPQLCEFGILKSFARLVEA